jgi:hypothetical protein
VCCKRCLSIVPYTTFINSIFTPSTHLSQDLTKRPCKSLRSSPLHPSCHYFMLCTADAVENYCLFAAVNCVTFSLYLMCLLTGCCLPPPPRAANRIHRTDNLKPTQHSVYSTLSALTYRDLQVNFHKLTSLV